jgi:NhaP-type Na+/H+ or K+/H+ antiporter
MLVEQEALLNDGAALVLFHLFFAGIQKSPTGNFDTIGIVVYFIRVLIISVTLTSKNSRR